MFEINEHVTGFGGSDDTFLCISHRLCFSNCRTPVLVLFSITLFGVLFIGLGDAIRLHNTHLRVRQTIDRLPVNAIPDPSRVFSFDHLVNGTPFNSVAVGCVNKSGSDRARSKSRDVVEQSVVLKKVPPSPSAKRVETTHPSPKLSWSSRVSRMAGSVVFMVGWMVRFTGAFFFFVVINPIQQMHLLGCATKPCVVQATSNTASSLAQKKSKKVVPLQTGSLVEDKFVDSDEDSSKSGYAATKVSANLLLVTAIFDVSTNSPFSSHRGVVLFCAFIVLLSVPILFRSFW